MIAHNFRLFLAMSCLLWLFAPRVTWAQQSLPLWPAGHLAVSGVSPDNVPAVTLYVPPRGASRAKVILVVCPGGGYRSLTLIEEGHNVASWYASKGMTAVVLKYRLPKNGKWSPENEYSPLRDAQRAVKLMRHQAASLGVPDAKIGMLGFSAGGHLACMTATRWTDPDVTAEDLVERHHSRPDFACLIYPVISFMDHGHAPSQQSLLGDSPSIETRQKYSGELNVTPDTPPIFIAQADNDPIKVENSVYFYTAMKKHNRPAELHIVSRGGHGFHDHKGWGIPNDENLQFARAGSLWPIWSINWMVEEKLIDHPSQWTWARGDANFAHHSR